MGAAHRMPGASDAGPSAVTDDVWLYDGRWCRLSDLSVDELRALLVEAASADDDELVDMIMDRLGLSD